VQEKLADKGKGSKKTMEKSSLKLAFLVVLLTIATC
jgi:hypothetical protein